MRTSKLKRWWNHTAKTRQRIFEVIILYIIHVISTFIIFFSISGGHILPLDSLITVLMLIVALLFMIGTILEFKKTWGDDDDN